MAVVIQHIFWHFSPGFATVFSTIWSPGRFGVVAFFIVSGFIVPRSLELRGEIKAFWTARFFRLYPSYWFSLLFIGLLPLAGIPALNTADLGSLKQWLANVTMLEGFAHIPDFNPVAWTLGLELVLYAAITLAFMKGLLKRTWLIALSILSLIAVSSVILPAVFHIRFPAGAAAVFGSILAGLALYRWFAGDLKKLEALAITLLCLGVTAASSIVNYPAARSTSDVLQPTQLCAILSAATGYLFFLSMLKFQGLKFPAWILWLGKVSYSLYLLHPIALAIVPQSLSPFAALPIQIGLSLAFAWFGYECIEMPSVETAKRLLKRGAIRVPPSTEPAYDKAA